MELGIDLNWYSSIAGIAGAAFLAGEATKRWLWDVPGLRAVPLVLIVMAYAGIGTGIAYGVMHSLEGDPWQLLVQAMTAGIAAVGGRSIVSNIAKPLGVTGQREFIRRRMQP